VRERPRWGCFHQSNHVDRDTHHHPPFFYGGVEARRRVLEHASHSGKCLPTSPWHTRPCRGGARGAGRNAPIARVSRLSCRHNLRTSSIGPGRRPCARRELRALGWWRATRGNGTFTMTCGLFVASGSCLFLWRRAIPCRPMPHISNQGWPRWWWRKVASRGSPLWPHSTAPSGRDFPVGCALFS
jgi:hypothetical protein